MSAKFSFANDSVPSPSPTSELPLGMNCYFIRPGLSIMTAFFITNITLMFLLCTPVFYLGFQQWRSTSTAAISPIDIITYHAVTMELFAVFGYILCLCGIYKNNSIILMVGSSLWCMMWFGEMFFNVLSCVARYLAVVHPVTYVSLKNERGTRIRNVSIGCVWLLCAAIGGLNVLEEQVYLYIYFIFSVLSLLLVSFCSLSVLCVLIRPGPGDQPGRRRVDQSKLRAFYTIMAITGVLLLRFACDVIWNSVIAVTGFNCLFVTATVWPNITCSVLQPLLFLHRAKFVCCKNSNK